MTQFLAAWLTIFAAVSGTQPREVPQSELSLAGVAIGDTEAQVVEKLGAAPFRTEEADFLHLHLNYESVTVSFGFEEVAGLYSDNPKGCTPAGLCPGDSLKRMRSVYGTPEVAKRETGTFFEYYSDCPCWLKIKPTGNKIESITVACQP